MVGLVGTSTPTAPIIEIDDVSGGSAALTDGYRVLSATGTYAYAGTWTANTVWAAAVVTYVAGGGPNTNRQGDAYIVQSDDSFWMWDGTTWVNGGSIQGPQGAQGPQGVKGLGYYSNNATHGAGTTITITQATHGLTAGRGIFVQVQDNSTGNVEIPDVTVDASGNVTITYLASVAANSKLVTLVR